MKNKYCLILKIYDEQTKRTQEQEELFCGNDLRQAQDKMEELVEEYQDMQLAEDCCAVIELTECSDKNQKILDSEAVGICSNDEYGDEYDNEYDDDDYDENYEDEYDEDENYEDESY